LVVCYFVLLSVEVYCRMFSVWAGVTITIACLPYITRVFTCFEH
jgi:hypothetical protein